MKWPDGFECRKCRHKEYWVTDRGLYLCTRREIAHSLTAGTVMHGTQKPLSYWFKAMWWFTNRKSGVNAVNLQDLLGLGSYQTAWIWFHKLRRCTIRRGRERLSGRVEVDEFYIWGQKPWKLGRGSNGKTIVVAAVEIYGAVFGRIRLQVIPDCSSPVLQAFINENIAPDSTIVTDGWNGYNAIDPEKHAHKQ